MSATQPFEKLVPAPKSRDGVVFWGSVAYSLFHLGLMWHAFLTGYYDPMYAMIIVHSIFVGLLYAIPKEYARWKGRKKASGPSRPGEKLVVVWVVSHTAMCFLAYVSKGKYDLPHGMTDMSGILFGTFCATYFSKQAHENKTGCPDGNPFPPEPPPSETKTPT